MERLNKFLCLPAADRRFLVKTLLLVWTVRLGLWLLPFRIMRHLLSTMTKGLTEAQANDSTLVNRIVWAVTKTSQYVPSATCLTQAVATKVLLGHYGHHVNVHLGVARSETGQFRAHAWVESNGTVIIGGSESFLKHYTPFPTLGEEVI